MMEFPMKPASFIQPMQCCESEKEACIARSGMSLVRRSIIIIVSLLVAVSSTSNLSLSYAPQPLFDTMDLLAHGIKNGNHGSLHLRHGSWPAYSLSFLCGVVVTSLFLALLFLYWKFKRARCGIGKDLENLDVRCLLNIRFTYKQLKDATYGFSPYKVLGKGGCSIVYKGLLTSIPSPVAIKKIYPYSSQRQREFVAEASIISRLRHRNLVPLIGWCHERKQLLLVYEFMPNGSLDRLLHSSTKRGYIPWDLRCNIIQGVASALAYLHGEWEQRVVHRDVKSSNIMLDGDFNPRLGDFGLARVCDHNKDPQSTRVAGTLGYMPPECYITGKVTEKTDVFSFGVMTLEVACGRRPVIASLPTKEMALVDWVWRLYKETRLLEAADKRLGSDYTKSEMECALYVGLLCTNLDPTKRPTMREVLQILKREITPPVLPTDRPMLFYPESPYNNRRLCCCEKCDRCHRLRNSLPTLVPSSSCVRAAAVATPSIREKP